MALGDDYFGGGGLDLSNRPKFSRLNKDVGNAFYKSGKFQRTEAEEALKDVIKAAQNMKGHMNKNRITNDELFGTNGVFSKLRLNPTRYKKEFGLDGYTNSEIAEMEKLLKYQAPKKEVVVPEEDMENN